MHYPHMQFQYPPPIYGQDFRGRSRSPRSRSRRRSRTRRPRQRTRADRAKIMNKIKKSPKPAREKIPRTLEEQPEKLFGPDWEEPKEHKGLKTVKDLAPQFKWSYPAWDDSRRSFAGLLRCPFSQLENQMYFDMIKNGTKWHVPSTGKLTMPRKTAWLVKSGCLCSYRYGAFEVAPAPFPPWMHGLLSQVMPKCGLAEEDDWPNCCNLNLYEDGGSGVGWHADDEALFQGRFQDIRIISLSFGVTRKFELRLNWPDEGERSAFRILLNSGDMMTMEGMMQKHFQHRVPREGSVDGSRINLTWRWVVKHTPHCPVSRIRR